MLGSAGSVASWKRSDLLCTRLFSVGLPVGVVSRGVARESRSLRLVDFVYLLVSVAFAVNREKVLWGVSLTLVR